MTAHKSCDRCGKPLQRFPEGWRHTLYAKRGEVCLHPSPAPAAPYVLENPPAVGAPKNSRWGYLPCGCSHDGRGGHVR
jgi:hypothetical protein